jgi:hypothetical protein
MNAHTFADDDFLKFHTAVLTWIQKLQITGWHVTVKHEQIGNGINAQVQYDVIARTTCFRLTKNTEGDYGEIHDPERLALHEVLHLMFANYCESTAKLADVQHDIVVSEEHSIIHRLSEVLK